MENVEIAKILEDYVDLLDIRDGKPFKVRSYRQAAKTVAGLSRPVSQILASEDEDLTELPAIGSSMSDHIEEILTTGSFEKLEKISKKFPRSLVPLMHLAGLGPKSTRALHDELGVETLRELRAAIESGEVRSLSGFGEKSEKKLRRAVDELEQLDLLVVSVHMQLDMSKKEMTERIVKALSHPAVNILAHPTERRINERRPIQFDLEEVFHAAREHDVALELDSQPTRLDLNAIHLHRARELGVRVAVDSDAHRRDHLDFMRHGIDQARRGWLEKKHVINASSWRTVQKWLAR